MHPDKLTANGWRASLALVLQRRAQTTALVSVRHLGPLRVQRPFYPEGRDVAHLYLLHPPGGVVGGDRLTLDIDIGAQAHAVVTTPGAAKFYRSPDALAIVEQNIRIADEGIAEWLPQETIYFSGARARSTIRVELGRRSQFIGWDIQCFGRPAAGEKFEAGIILSRFEIWREGCPLCLECTRVADNAAMLFGSWGLGGFTVSATMWCAAEDASCVESLREQCQSQTPGLFAVTQRSGVVVCRYLGSRAEEARQVFLRAWERLRPHFLGRLVCPPRVWAT